MIKHQKFLLVYHVEHVIDLDCSQRAFPPLHKKFDVDINSRGVSVYVNDKSS